jgi:hypothetical protein
MGKKLNLENTLTVQNHNGEWMCIWKGTDSDGRQVWCRIGTIYNCDEVEPPKGVPFGSKKSKN